MARNLLQLATAVANLLQRQISDFTIQSEDMLIQTINAVRREAELQHDFWPAKVLVDLTLDGVAGGALADATLHGAAEDADAVLIKSIIEIGLYDDNGVSISGKKWQSYDVYQAQLRSIGDPYDPEVRYPSDAGPTVDGSSPSYVILGGRVFMVPAGTAGVDTDIGLYVNSLIVDYETSEDPEDFADITDWFIEYGFNFLKWKTVTELNHQFKEFVFRQEGNLMPPEKQAERAWDALIRWDSFQDYQFLE